MTVEEMIEVLKKYPGRARVVAAWEGVESFLAEEDFKLIPNKRGEVCLMIDAEEGYASSRT
jgi:hypothetical protein